MIPRLVFEPNRQFRLQRDFAITPPVHDESGDKCQHACIIGRAMSQPLYNGYFPGERSISKV